MISLLQSLEPISCGMDEIIINELDEQNEITFFVRGDFKVGYEINKV